MFAGEVEAQVIPKLTSNDNTSGSENNSGSDTTTNEGETKPVTETIQVNTGDSTVKANVIVTKDSNGNVTDAYAVITVVSAEIKSSKAVVTIDNDVIQAILNAVPSTDRIEIVIDKSIIDVAMKAGNKDELPIKIVIAKDLKVKDKQIIIASGTLDSAKTANRKLTVLVSDGVNPTYTVTVPQSVLKSKNSKFTDVDITLEASKKTSKTASVSIGDEGTLPMAVSFSVSVKDILSTKTNSKVYVYKVNAKTGKLEEVPNNVKTVSSAGNITMSTLVSGDFIFSTSKKTDVVLLVDKVSLATTKTSVSVGSSLNLKAVLPSELALVTKFTNSDPYGMEEAKVTYSISNKSIATISSSGKLVAKKAGKVKVKVTILLENNEKKVIEKTITVK